MFKFLYLTNIFVNMYVYILRNTYLYLYIHVYVYTYMLRNYRIKKWLYL